MLNALQSPQQLEPLSGWCSTQWAAGDIPKGRLMVRGLKERPPTSAAHEASWPFHFSFSTGLFAGANAQGSQDCRAVAIMRYEDSEQPPPMSDKADGEYTDRYTPPAPRCAEGGLLGSKVWLVVSGKEPDGDSLSGVWGPGAGGF